MKPSKKLAPSTQEPNAARTPLGTLSRAMPFPSPKDGPLTSDTLPDFPKLAHCLFDVHQSASVELCLPVHVWNAFYDAAVGDYLTMEKLIESALTHSSVVAEFHAKMLREAKEPAMGAREP